MTRRSPLSTRTDTLFPDTSLFRSASLPPGRAGGTGMATTAGGAARAELFWHRMAIGLAVFIVFGFLQFALRGFVDPVAAPFWVHVHGAALLAWLALLIAPQPFVTLDHTARHHQLGRNGGVAAAL